MSRKVEKMRTAILGGVAIAVAIVVGTVHSPVAHGQTPALSRSGRGDGSVGQFRNPTGSFQICVNAVGRSSSGDYGPDATVFIEMVHGTGTDAYSYDSDDIDMAGNPGCESDTLDPGTYSVKVVATSWTSWSVAVYPSNAGYASYTSGTLNTVSVPTVATSNTVSTANGWTAQQAQSIINACATPPDAWPMSTCACMAPYIEAAWTPRQFLNSSLGTAGADQDMFNRIAAACGQ